ncbi:GntR family transcriptional regulator [Bryobacter aggregatus]|uniref:GntR family transcriptional regulator n=1 Tax=Bryobacter aggregatus TaxID=360054 RepID=UPI0012BA8424|nr:GntR family transcriptional regulator [Bryobacter aggregatus]
MSDRIADMIRRMILNGELESGQRIVESRWAKQLGVGQPTMREALVALEHEGLVMRRANQGAEVVSLSSDEITQALRIRAELEELAVEIATESASAESLKRMKAIAKDMMTAARSRNTKDFFAKDREWHQTLWQATGNTFLERMLGQLMSPLLAFLFLRNLRHYAKFDLRASAQAHIDMVDVIASRDTRRARKFAHEKFTLFARDHEGALSQAQAS